MSERIEVRPFAEPDIPRVLELMRGLATFEDYIDDFRVTASDLKEHGLCSAPRFHVFVAQHARGLAPAPSERPSTQQRIAPTQPHLDGIAVVYEIPWTYDLRPTLILKELFVDERARGCGLGQALMRAVAEHAHKHRCPRVAWTVLKSNLRGAAFYRGLGAKQDHVWDAWSWDESAIHQMCER